MNKNKKMILAIGIILIIVLSFLLFFGIGENNKNEIQISAFVFIILDELITYGVILWGTSEKANTFSIAGLASCTFIYLIISLVGNVLLNSVFNTVKSILVFNFSILLVYAFVVTLVMLFKKENK